MMVSGFTAHEKVNSSPLPLSPSSMPSSLSAVDPLLCGGIIWISTRALLGSQMAAPSVSRPCFFALHLWWVSWLKYRFSHLTSPAQGTPPLHHPLHRNLPLLAHTLYRSVPPATRVGEKQQGAADILQQEIRLLRFHMILIVVLLICKQHADPCVGFASTGQL